MTPDHPTSFDEPYDDLPPPEPLHYAAWESEVARARSVL